MTFSKQFQKTITTSKTFIPDEPDFSATNPLKKNVFCNGVEIICSPEFTRKGAVVIKVDGITQFDSRNSGGFLRIGKLPITLNTPMKRDVIVDVFVFNEIDTNEISCTVTVFLSEESKNLDSSLQYISDDVVNSLISKNEILFVRADYFNQTLIKLLDMAGYKKLIILIGKQVGGLPTVIFGTPVIADGDLNTGQTSISPTLIAGEVTLGIIDFGTVALRHAKSKAREGNSNPNNTVFIWRIYTSDDNITYNLKNSRSDIQSGQDFFLDGTEHSFRYIKFTIQYVSGGDGGGSGGLLYELYNANQIGGSAELSFEVLETETNTWLTLIPATDIQTITFGLEKRIEIGQIESDPSTFRFYATLPSTQTDFRAVLKVTDALNVGISIIKTS